jgi:hypothetical protein
MQHLLVEAHKNVVDNNSQRHLPKSRRVENCRTTAEFGKLPSAFRDQIRKGQSLDRPFDRDNDQSTVTNIRS